MLPAAGGKSRGAGKCQASEPHLLDIIDEPIVRAVMDADGISIGELRRLLTDAMTVYDAAPIGRPRRGALRQHGGARRAELTTPARKAAAAV
jgi:hypothetical protein